MEKMLEFIEEMTTNVDAVQERVLEEILGRNADAEYLAAKCGLAGAKDCATFRAKVPMVTYDQDLLPYIRRIANGDRSPVLTGLGNPISEFLVSTGTSTGEPKLIPIVKDENDRRILLKSLKQAVMSKNVPGLNEGRGLYFNFVKSETKTPGGLTAWTGLTSLFKSEHVKTKLPYHNLTSPKAVILCEDTSQSMYAHMLCGLCQRHSVQRIGAPFAYGLLGAIRFLQLNWRQLASDIEAGELSDRVTDPSVRQAVAGVLQAPDPELARFIRMECSGKDDDGCWAGIITRIWPNAKYLDAIATGSMAQYVPALNYYSGGLPIVSAIYGCSECAFGLNLRPMCDPSEVSYTIMPNMAYFEFLPVDDAKDPTTTQQLVELASVEVGHEYEPVVTNYAGLCRYRMGDVLRVTGFHNAAPQFRFVCRKNMVLSIDAEKTNEADLQRAVERASALLLRRTPHGGAAVQDYTSRACTASIPGHYVIYWELVTKGDDDATVDKETLDRCCLEMEEALNAMYRKFRVADSIGPLEIRVVQPCTFEQLIELAVSRGASVGQYKTPRCVAAPAIIELLDSHVVSNHFSPKLPQWSLDEQSDLDRQRMTDVVL